MRGDVYLRIPGICRDFHAKNPHGRISVAASPCWVPGRINIVEDLAFFSLYLHRQKVGPIIMSPRHSPLFEPLVDHFQSVWSATTREVYDSGNQIKAADSAAAPKIFVSYARDDGAFARLVRNRLVSHFDHVYFDVESNVLGENFVTRMLSEIRRSDVVVMVAGGGALPKLLDENSYFRKEVEEALRLNKLLIPVYHGLKELTKGELPKSLHRIAERHAVMVDKGTTEMESRLDQLILQVRRQC